MSWIQTVKQGQTNLVLPDRLHSGGLWSTTQDFYHGEYERLQSGLHQRLARESAAPRQMIATSNLMPGHHNISHQAASQQGFRVTGVYRRLFGGHRNQALSVRPGPESKREFQPLSVENLKQTESLAELSRMFEMAGDTVYSSMLNKNGAAINSESEVSSSRSSSPFSPMEHDWPSPIAASSPMTPAGPYVDRSLPHAVNQPHAQSHMQGTEINLPMPAQQRGGLGMGQLVCAPPSIEYSSQPGQPSVPQSVAAAPVAGRMMDLVVEPSEGEIRDLTSSDIDTQDCATTPNRSPSFHMLERSLSHKKLRVRLTAIMDNMTRQNRAPFILDDKLKPIKPYLIFGWTSDSYLKTLMEKTHLVGEMFDNALDNVGEIRKEVAEQCQKKNPVVLTRELVYRVFTLGELENTGMKFQRLSRRKMGAVRRCVTRYFPELSQRVWNHSCLWKLRCHMTFILSKQVKKVQRQWKQEAQKRGTVATN